MIYDNFLRPMVMVAVALLVGCGTSDAPESTRDTDLQPRSEQTSEPGAVSGDPDPAAPEVAPGLAAAPPPASDSRISGPMAEPAQGRASAATTPGSVAAPATASDGSAAGGAAQNHDVLDRAERVYAGIRSMQADFSQVVTVPLLNQTIRSAGRIYHRRPDRFLMDFSDPPSDVIVADGRYLWMYYPSADRRQVIRTTLAEAGGSVDLHREFLSNASARYQVTDLGTETIAGRPAQVLRLRPRAESPYDHVRIWIDLDDHMVRRFVLVEANETVRRLDLRNIRTNIELRDDLFSFTPPPDAQIFDSGR